MADTDTTAVADELANALVVSTPDGELHEKSDEYVQNIINSLNTFDLFLQAVSYRMQMNPRPDDDQKLELGFASVRREIETQLKNIADFEQAFHDGKVNAAGEKPDSVGAPGAWTGLIPIYGSGRSAVNDFENDHPVWGTINTLFAISDVFLVKDIIEAIAKGGVNIGFHSFKWSATRARLGQAKTFLGIELEPYAQKGQPIHHWLFQRNQGIGKMLPDWAKNQAYNYLRIPEKLPAPFSEYTAKNWHDALHGQGRIQLGLLRRVWYGTPNWPKLVVVSYGGRATEYALDGQDKR